MSLVVRSSLPPAALARSLRDAVAAIDPEQPIVRLRTMSDVVSGALERPRLGTLLLVAFAAVALFLAALGIYGVLSYAIARRVREIGIRRALGARDGDLVRMVVRDGLKLALLGIAAGTVAAVALSRLVAGLVFGVSATDPR